MINTFEAQMQLGCAAVVSLMILAVNLFVKGIVFALKGRCASAVLKGKGKRIASELERVNDVSDDTLSELAEIRSRLGL